MANEVKDVAKEYEEYAVYVCRTLLSPASIHHMFKVFGIALTGVLKQSNFPAPSLSMDVALVMGNPPGKD